MDHCDYLITSGLGSTFGQDIQDSALVCPSPMLGREVQDLAMAEQDSPLCPQGYCSQPTHRDRFLLHPVFTAKHLENTANNYILYATTDITMSDCTYTSNFTCKGAFLGYL